jgi:hypothetical protein
MFIVDKRLSSGNEMKPFLFEIIDTFSCLDLEKKPLIKFSTVFKCYYNTGGIAKTTLDFPSLKFMSENSNVGYQYLAKS